MASPSAADGCGACAAAARGRPRAAGDGAAAPLPAQDGGLAPAGEAAAALRHSASEVVATEVSSGVRRPPISRRHAAAQHARTRAVHGRRRGGAAARRVVRQRGSAPNQRCPAAATVTWQAHAQFGRAQRAEAIRNASCGIARIMLIVRTRVESGGAARGAPQQRARTRDLSPLGRSLVAALVQRHPARPLGRLARRGGALAAERRRLEEAARR